MVKQDFKGREEEIEILVLQAQQGSTDAFAKLYDLYVNPLYRYIYFKVPKEDALDLTENLFLKLWEHIRSYNRRKNRSFSHWVFRIAHNLVVDHYRSQKDSLPLDFTVPDRDRQSDPVYVTESNLSKGFLKVAISKLKKKYQQILLLKYVSDLENAEIALIMKKSEGSLRILKFRALQALKKVLEGMDITY